MSATPDPAFGKARSRVPEQATLVELKPQPTERRCELRPRLPSHRLAFVVERDSQVSRGGGAIMSAMADTALSPLERARGAAAAHRWSDAYELLRLADREEPLGGRDLELLADSAWTTSLSESISRARARLHELRHGRLRRRRCESRPPPVPRDRPPWPGGGFAGVARTGGTSARRSAGQSVARLPCARARAACRIARGGDRLYFYGG